MTEGTIPTPLAVFSIICLIGFLISLNYRGKILGVLLINLCWVTILIGIFLGKQSDKRRKRK